MQLANELFIKNIHNHRQPSPIVLDQNQGTDLTQLGFARQKVDLEGNSILIEKKKEAVNQPNKSKIDHEANED